LNVASTWSKIRCASVASLADKFGLPADSVVLVSGNRPDEFPCFVTTVSIANYVEAGKSNVVKFGTISSMLS
jgi:hypothetical protein